jgi:hypothetical protein
MLKILKNEIAKEEAAAKFAAFIQNVWRASAYPYLKSKEGQVLNPLCTMLYR